MSKKNILKKVILSGGYTARAKDGGASFCLEIVKDLQRPIIILECLFGLAEDLWEKSTKKDKELFAKVIGDEKIKFEIAKPDKFVEQIKSADVIYFRGGDTEKLYKHLSEINGWQESLINRVVIGSSAGAYILSEYYIHNLSESEFKFKKGFGLLPIKTVAHYKTAFYQKGDIGKAKIYWDNIDKSMKNNFPHLDSIKLEEGKFIVLH